MAQLYARKTSDGRPKALECTDGGVLAGLATAAAQEEANEVLESIAGKHVGGPVVITQNSTSQAVAVPALAKSFRVSTKGGAANLNIDAAATADSVLYVPDESIDYYPITGGTHTLYCYGTAGKAYFSFLG